MPTTPMSRAIDELRRAFLRTDADALPDRELLDRFRRSHDEAAFGVLVSRHARLVMGVCRRVLGHCQDAEDAFQAAFLVLARKAGAVVDPERLANWLYGVAYRTALKARTMRAKRRVREVQVSTMPERAAPAADSTCDLKQLFDREIDRLPEKYRLPVVLCDLEGRTQRDAANQLGWLEGTLSGRLSRAHGLLAKRLSRPGSALSVGGLALLFSQAAASAETPAPLAAATTLAASLMATGQAGLVSAHVVALTEGVLRAMWMTKLKLLGGVFALLLTATVGAAYFVPGTVAHRTTDGVVALYEAAVAQEQERAERGAPAGAVIGKVVDVAKDKKSLTLETRPAQRGGEPGKVAIHLTDKTDVTYFGVGPGAATPTAGYQAQVVLQKDSTDTAAQVQFRTAGPGTVRTIGGTVADVSADGKKITLEIPTGRGPDAEKKKVEFTLDEKTDVKYVALPKDTQPKAGFQVDLWLERGGDRSAPPTVKKAVFTDTARLRNASLLGKVVAVADGGKTLTVETRGNERGAAAGKVTLKIASDAEVTFQGVGPDGAVAAEGQMINAWLVEGTTDTAWKVMLSKAGSRGR
jgi:RNA polymerase sigma factor (sigma-70 family)